ncbi:hypothetical protein M6B38_320360 [Iris pallida]|uniref:Uncharacterized protein n=1 Tax=Iris pallida TaxID=29817 RepID=A0AAX6HD19_IRIPA|nr:hypothetical protein M6B38_320360 [Iris pallida]
MVRILSIAAARRDQLLYDKLSQRLGVISSPATRRHNRSSSAIPSPPPAFVFPTTSSASADPRVEFGAYGSSLKFPGDSFFSSIDLLPLCELIVPFLRRRDLDRGRSARSSSPMRRSPPSNQQRSLGEHG